MLLLRLEVSLFYLGRGNPVNNSSPMTSNPVLPQLYTSRPHVYPFDILLSGTALLTFRRLTSTIVDVPHRWTPKLHFIYLFNKYRYRRF